MEDACLGVSLLFFISTECGFSATGICSILDRTDCKSVPVCSYRYADLVSSPRVGSRASLLNGPGLSA
jgi:hypothetical protein